MASTIPSQAYFDEISETLFQARQALDRSRRALIESLGRRDSTIDVPKKKHGENSHTTLEPRLTPLGEASEELDALEGWLEAMEGLVQRLLEDLTNTTNTMTPAIVVVGNKQNQEWPLSGSRARYVIVVLLLSASLLATLFALFFVSTQK